MSDDWTSADTTDPRGEAATPAPTTAPDAPATRASAATPGSGDPLDAIRGIKLPALPARAAPTDPLDEWSTAPATDHVEAGRAQRADRQASVRAKRRNAAVVGGLVAAAVAVVLIAVVAIVVLREPATTRVLAQGPGYQVKNHAVGTTKAPVVSTPAFARVGKMRVYLPIDPKAITAVAFHQSAYGRSYHMASLVPVADRQGIFNLVKAGKRLPLACATSSVTGIDERDGLRVVDSTWKGDVVRLWRSGRSGSPDSAADCGAKAGTTVVAPVSGTVERIRSYRLYGRYPDYEIHIKPAAMRQADLVVIHVQDLTVKPGDHVVGGITPIAHVRLLSNQLEHQLREYTGDPGDHTHIQFNWPKSGDNNAG